MATGISADPGVPCALIRARSRLRVSTHCPRLEVKAPRRRSFSCGNTRFASGRNIMNRAMSSTSIRSVLARVPRLAANASIWAGGNCRAAIPAVSQVDHSRHSCPPGASKQPARPMHERVARLARDLHPCSASRARVASGSQCISSQSRLTSMPMILACDICPCSLPSAPRS